MKKLLNTLLLLAMVQCAVYAIPAKPGVRKMITLADGSTVMAELRGDEKMSYWTAADGRNFVKGDAAFYVETDVEALRDQVVSQHTAVMNRSGKRKTAGIQPSEPIVGEMNGLVVLVQFDDLQFEDGHDVEFYKRVLNEPGFTTEDGFCGSVRDYFLAQSEGQLDYQFDVVGPITLPYEYAYYGQNTSSTTQKNMKTFITSSLNALKGSIDFSQYDNDGDGYVDQVFFLYAGYGEADSGDEDTIWPHMYYAYTAYGVNFVQNGVRVDAYACSCELQDGGATNGIGAFCHEFSHCLGLPDMYCTTSAGNYGNNYWDIMDVGCYLGNTYQPCGYNAYERYFCGWKQLEELTASTSIENAKALSDGGHAYVMYNDNDHDEYFILEPRNTTGWDASLPNNGLLVYHVDFDATVWQNNGVNNEEGHQRCAIVAADNNYRNSAESQQGDAFPYKDNDAFGDDTTPASTLFNANTDGSFRLGKGIRDIKRNDDGTVSFVFETVDNGDGIESISINASKAISYNLAGQAVSDSYNGIRIQEGRKILNIKR